MKICLRQYRIVTDDFGGFEVQKKVWYFPFWLQIPCENGIWVNTHRTIEKAEQLIEIDKNNLRKKDHKKKVVKVFDCG